MKNIAEWLIKALILLLTTQLVIGFQIDSLLTALLIVLVLGLFNMVIKPILLFLTLPINIITLGLFTFIVNAFLLYVTAKIIPGFHIESFGVAIVGAVVIAVLSALANLIIKS